MKSLALGCVLVVAVTSCSKGDDPLAVCGKLEAAGSAKTCAKYTPSGVVWQGAADAAEFTDPADASRKGAVMVYRERPKYDAAKEAVLGMKGLAGLAGRIYAKDDALLIVRVDREYSDKNVAAIASTLSLTPLTSEIAPPTAKAGAKSEAPAPHAEDPSLKFQEQIAESDNLCKRLKVDVATYYGKPQTLTTVLKPSDYYNFKYSGKQTTHYAFKMKCGGGLSAYAAKDKFKDLFEYVMANPDTPVQAVVVTDKGHESSDIYTLTGWQKLIDGKAPMVPPATGELTADSSEDLCRRLTVDVATYYGKPQTIIGSVKADDYYNYKFMGKESTHYSFRVKCGSVLHVYAPKDKFKDLFEYLMENAGSDVKLTILTDKSHGSSDIYSLVSWEKTK